MGGYSEEGWLTSPGLSRGSPLLTLGSSCSITCRCRNLRSAGDRRVRETPAPSFPWLPTSSLAQACSPRPGRSCQEPGFTHPLHEALSNVPRTAAALQVLQELTVEEGKVRNCLLCPPQEGLPTVHRG